MNAFSIGVSALSAGQTALDLIGQNIANAGTPGYHRQAVNLVATTSGGKVGTGVDVATLTRYTAAPARTAILSGNAAQSAVSTQLDTSQQVEATIAGAGGIGDGLTSFFNQITSLTATPDDSAVRIPVIASASDLAQQFNTASNSLDQLRGNLGSQITQSVSQINTFATQIADLNTKIATATEAGQQPNDLLDQRDQVIDQLSQQIDVRTVQQPNGVVNVLSANAPIVVGTYANQFQAAPDPSGNYQITQAGVTQPVSVSSGQLGGLLEDYNQNVPAATSQLDGIAAALISHINEVQATGIGTSGPLTTASGTVSVADPTQPLATQNLPFPIQAGQLTVSVTDTTTGDRTNTTINIDPATQSLQDIATALSGVPGLSASVDPASGTLQISAQSGFAFDFAGRDTNPASNTAVANPDSANVLSGLGVNGLFTGTDATSIAVNPAIVSNPALLAASKTGQPGDSTNLQQMAAVGNQPVLSGQTISGAFTDLATGVGTVVNSLTDQQTAQSGVLQNLNAQEQAVTGVDTNEEMVNLLGYQRMIEGASQYMSAVNTALDSIMNIVNH